MLQDIVYCLYDMLRDRELYRSFLLVKSVKSGERVE